MRFNFADIWEMTADAVPEREALVVGDARRTYAQLEQRANALANHLAASGLGRGQHLALYLENCVEYVEAMLAAFKLGAVPINVNHRYVAGELEQLLINSDSEAVLTQPSLAPTVAAVLAGGGVGQVRSTLEVGPAYEAALAAASTDRPSGAARSGDDRYVIYTGGTTGLPKGVEWRQEDAFFACLGGGDPMRLEGPVERPEQLAERIVDQPVCYLTLAPMMHAAAQWTAFSWLFAGGKVVLTAGAFDPVAAWHAVEAEGVQILTAVGDAMSRPLLDAWDAAAEAGTPHNIGSLFVYSNGGAPLSASTKERVFATFPHLMLNDGFGSSEAGVQGASRLSSATAADAASVVTFSEPTKPTVVVDADGVEVSPGSGRVGQVLAGGRLPVGYYRDPERTAESFVTYAGARWLVTGDLATVTEEGAISLLGRDASVINTGGEKVFAEEVEAVLKSHPDVYDCLVVGSADERWGSAVTAVVQPRAAVPTLEDLARHCKDQLAGYKAPKYLVTVDKVVRSPSGKADYQWAREVARRSVADRVDTEL